MFLVLKEIVHLINLMLFIYGVETSEVCLVNDLSDAASKYLAKYLFYDVNPAEGFNLRRDVYMRLAVSMKMQESSCRSTGSDWHLVLPPWPHLYHWQSLGDVGLQHFIPWSQFFDVASMKRYLPVVEMHEIIKQTVSGLDVVLILQNFKEAFTDSWTWENKWEFSECNPDTSTLYMKMTDYYEGYFWGYQNITSKDLFCVSFQGQASNIKEVLDSVDRRLVMIDHAEVALHDWFGNAEYWKCRRSMRFSTQLISAAAEFRRIYLNSTDESDNTVKPLKWEDEKLDRNALGGPYLAAHLRRQDFEFSRKNEIPSLNRAAEQISDYLKRVNLNKVFISTDAPLQFIDDLKNRLSEYEVYHLDQSLDNRRKFGDGGLAVMDQIICSYARYFIGTFESTFSFRIQEEREILGFPQDSTFNRFCGSKRPCVQPTRWLISH